MANVLKASFDTTTTEGKVKVFNAQSGTSISLKNLENGTVIEGSDILIVEDMVDSFGKPQEAKITTIFSPDGSSYAGVSETISKSADNLIDLIADLALQSFKVKILHQQSSKGNEFLNLQLIL